MRAARRRRSYLAVVLASLAALGCSSAAEPPSRLVDGTPADSPSVPLGGANGPAVLTVARSPRPASLVGCAAVRPPGARVLERVGVGARSVTVVDRSGRAVRSCDAVDGQGRPCATAFGRIRAGRLEDARLTVTCETAGGPMAFAWMQPRAATRYVRVDRDGWSEVYPVVDHVPVRITSEDVDLAGSARFRVAEHDERGREIASYVLEPRVAG